MFYNETFEKRMSKKFVLPLTACLALAAAVLSVMSSCGKETASFSLKYSASGGGSIAGFSVQTVGGGKKGKGVRAVADPGYYFSEWSDGLKAAEREDTAKGDAEYTAYFKPIKCEIEYFAGPNGYLLAGGERVDSGFSVVKNAIIEDKLPTVTAVAAEGYVFASWDDGLEAAERNDSDFKHSTTFTARFEAE